MFKHNYKYSLKQNTLNGLWHILRHKVNKDGKITKTSKLHKNLPKYEAEDVLFKLERT